MADDLASFLQGFGTDMRQRAARPNWGDTRWVGPGGYMPMPAYDSNVGEFLANAVTMAPLALGSRGGAMRGNDSVIAHRLHRADPGVFLGIEVGPGVNRNPGAGRRIDPAITGGRGGDLGPDGQPGWLPNSSAEMTGRSYHAMGMPYYNIQRLTPYDIGMVRSGQWNPAEIFLGGSARPTHQGHQARPLENGRPALRVIRGDRTD